MHQLSRIEIIQAQAALFLAIGLQLVGWVFNDYYASWSQYIILFAEVSLFMIIALTIHSKRSVKRGLQHHAALALLAIMTVVNIGSLVMVLTDLVLTRELGGVQLLGSALAIFITNIIVFALWYWEVDSPGLTRRQWTKNDKDFQFVQQDMADEFPEWKPRFPDYLYLSLSNAINFAPADTKPLNHGVKFMMGAQALVSVFTLALVLARAVSILS